MRVTPKILFSCFFLVVVMTVSSLLWMPQAEARSTVNIITGEGISNREVVVVANAVRAATEHIKKKYHQDLLSDVTVILKRGAMNAGVDTERSNTRLGQIVLALPEGKSDYFITFMATHELVHQYQIERVGATTLSRAMWFTEGMADYIGMEVANQLEDKTTEFYLYADKSIYYPYDLMDISSKEGWHLSVDKGNPYAMADRAVILLVTAYPDKNLFHFLVTLPNRDIRAAFRLTYNTELDVLNNMIKKAVDYTN